MKELIEQIKDKIDLRYNDISQVSKTIPSIYCDVIDLIHNETGKLVNLEKQFNKQFKDIMDYYINESDVDIFSVLKNQGDRTVYIKGTDKLNELNEKIAICQYNIKLLENLAKFVKDVSLNVKNIIEYEKFKTGQ